jgi:nucleoside-diphosphate-sugar epimerase/tetratricopeptide (TPR) repeat protein
LMRVAVTGATGYIGERLVKLLHGNGYEVLALSRQCPSYAVSNWFHYEIQSTENILPEKVDAIIHLAAIITEPFVREEQEINAAVCLLKHAQKCSAIFIFISSQSAKENAPTSYGKVKWAIEKPVLANGGIVVRPGLVYGGELRGLFGRIAGFVYRMPLLPAFLPGPKIQPVHVDDLTIAIQRLVEGFGSGGKTYSIGQADPLTFTAFILAIVRYRLRLTRIMVPMPSFFVSFLARFSSKKSVLNQLQSLLLLEVMDTADSLKELRLNLRCLESGLQPCGRGRRALLLEALTLYSYVMDVSGIRINPSARRRIIDDSYAKALYFNNIGAEALIKNDLPTAWAYMARAIETEPLLTDSWVNMGVVLGRNEQLQDAAYALRKALQIDPSEHSALSNLYEVYIAMEDFESAAQLEDKVERYRQKNPYYLLQLSEEALLQDRYKDSLKLLQRAIKINKNDHQLHFALAITQYLSGDPEAAAHSLLRARELAPQNMIAYYDRPLNELVAEAELNRNLE